MGPFQVGTAVAIAYDENGMLGVQTDAHGDTAGSPMRYHVGVFGSLARPLDADDDGGALALYSDEGRDGFAWFGHDHRDLSRLPQVSGGSNGYANSLGAFFLQDYATATTTIYQPIANRTKAHKILVGVDGNDVPTIDLLHSSGACLTITDTEAMLRHTGNAYVEVKGSNVTLNGAVNAPTGISVGGAAAQPLVNATALAAALTALAAPFTSGGVTPVPSSAIGALLTGIAAALTGAAGTQMLKGL